MDIAMDQRRHVMAALRQEVKDLDQYEPGDPAPYVNCRPWGTVVLLAGVYTGPDKRLQRQHRDVVAAMGWTLKALAEDHEITLYRADGLIAGVWLGQPLGNGRAKVSLGDRDAVMVRDDYACVLCDATDDLTIDHIFPLAAGGADDPVNFRVLCRSCNSAKGASIPDEVRLLGRKREP